MPMNRSIISQDLRSRCRRSSELCSFSLSRHSAPDLAALSLAKCWRALRVRSSEQPAAQVPELSLQREAHPAPQALCASHPPYQRLLERTAGAQTTLVSHHPRTLVQSFSYTRTLLWAPDMNALTAFLLLPRAVATASTGTAPTVAYTIKRLYGSILISCVGILPIVFRTQRSKRLTCVLSDFPCRTCDLTCDLLRCRCDFTCFGCELVA